MVDKKGRYKRNSGLCNVIGFGNPFERHYGCKMIEGSLVEKLPIYEGDRRVTVQSITIVQSSNGSVKYYLRLIPALDDSRVTESGD